MIRGLGLAGAAATACLAFLGGQGLGGSDEQPAKAKPRGPKLDPAPAVLSSAGRPVALPVISVRQLPLLAPPHQKRAPKAPAVVAPAVRAPASRQVTPSPPPATTPKPQTTQPPGGNGGSGGGGGGGGYFDDPG